MDAMVLNDVMEQSYSDVGYGRNKLFYMSFLVMLAKSLFSFSMTDSSLVKARVSLSMLLISYSTLSGNN